MHLVLDTVHYLFFMVMTMFTFSLFQGMGQPMGMMGMPGMQPGMGMGGMMGGMPGGPPGMYGAQQQPMMGGFQPQRPPAPNSSSNAVNDPFGAL